MLPLHFVELDIRCAYARALILEQIHGERAEIVQDAFFDVRDAAIGIGMQDFNGGIDTIPIFFVGEPLLVKAWHDGYAMEMEASSCFEDDSDDNY